MERGSLTVLIALHFASCLSSLTLLIGEGWRVRYALIRCFAILQRPASDGRIRETSVQPARLPGQMAPHHLPSHPQEADVRGSRPLRGIWKMSGLGEQPWTVPPPLQPSLQTDSPGLCSAVPHLWTHWLASGATQNSNIEDTAKSSTITTILVLCFIPQPFLEIRSQRL